MKLRVQFRVRGGPVNSRRMGFTFTELMVTMSVFMLVMAGVMVSHLSGQRMFQLTQAKLAASNDARKAITKLADEIRSAKVVRIGTGSLNSFTEIADGSQQYGSAIQLYLSTNMTGFIRYFWDSGDKKLKRTTTGDTAADVVANSVTNNLIFSSENYAGTVLTNNQNNRVIGLTLQFYQLQYPVIAIGPGGLYDFYQIRTRITRRALE